LAWYGPYDAQDLKRIPTASTLRTRQQLESGLRTLIEE
jgi:hypothetical protein